MPDKPDPSSTEDYRTYPKGPNFLAVVIGFCVAILVIAIATMLLLHRSGNRLFPMKTNSTPSHTMIRRAAPRPFEGA